jgi:hypothetical protein
MRISMPAAKSVIQGTAAVLPPADLDRPIPDLP